MMRKEFRPFDAKKAAAGEPFGARSELYEAQIFIYGDTYVIGAVRKCDSERWSAFEWSAAGLRYSPAENPCDLVMIPGAFCQGKAVYVGDRLFDENGEVFDVDLHDLAQASWIARCTWECSPVSEVMLRKVAYEVKQAALACFINRDTPAAKKIAQLETNAIASRVMNGEA